MRRGAHQLCVHLRAVYVSIHHDYYCHYHHHHHHDVDHHHDHDHRGADHDDDTAADDHHHHDHHDHHGSTDHHNDAGVVWDLAATVPRCLHRGRAPVRELRRLRREGVRSEPELLRPDAELGSPLRLPGQLLLLP